MIQGFSQNTQGICVDLFIQYNDLLTPCDHRFIVELVVLGNRFPEPLLVVSGAREGINFIVLGIAFRCCAFHPCIAHASV